MAGKVVWITGLSGVGKSTLAKSLADCMVVRGREPVILDGDEVRAAIADAQCGHDREARLVNAYRISRLARIISSQGRFVIVATMSLFHEIHQWNRENIAGYLEVLLDVPLETLQQRDGKRLYVRGEDLPGVDIEAELPLNPDIHVFNGNYEKSPVGIADEIVRRLESV
jgi:adenylylsulfate kinase-like enzyme